MAVNSATTQTGLTPPLQQPLVNTNTAPANTNTAPVNTAPVQLSCVSTLHNDTVQLILPKCIQQYLTIESDSTMIATIAKLVLLSIPTLIVSIGSFAYNNIKWVSSHIFCCCPSSTQPTPNPTPNPTPGNTGTSPTPPTPNGISGAPTPDGTAPAPSLPHLPSPQELAQQRIAAFMQANPQFKTEVKQAREQGILEGARAVEEVQRHAKEALNRITQETKAQIQQVRTDADRQVHDVTQDAAQRIQHAEKTASESVLRAQLDLESTRSLNGLLQQQVTHLHNQLIAARSQTAGVSSLQPLSHSHSHQRRAPSSSQSDSDQLLGTSTGTKHTGSHRPTRAPAPTLNHDSSDSASAPSTRLNVPPSRTPPGAPPQLSSTPAQQNV